MLNYTASAPKIRRIYTMAYWLMKSEPDVYTIDELEKSGRDIWRKPTRNYQVRNMLRDDMKVGDEIFFYRSNCKEIGISGVQKSLADRTQTQLSSITNHTILTKRAAKIIRVGFRSMSNSSENSHEQLRWLKSGLKRVLKV